MGVEVTAADSVVLSGLQGDTWHLHKEETCE